MTETFSRSPVTYQQSCSHCREPQRTGESHHWPTAVVAVVVVVVATVEVVVVDPSPYQMIRSLMKGIYTEHQTIPNY